MLGGRKSGGRDQKRGILNGVISSIEQLESHVENILPLLN